MGKKLEKMPAWQLTKVRSKKKRGHSGSIEEKNSPFCFADGYLSSQEVQVRTTISKLQRPSGTPCDTVENDSGYYAVFTEQNSSASQMTAAKVLDVTARPPDCADQEADEVSAYTQVQMEDAPVQ